MAGSPLVVSSGRDSTADGHPQPPAFGQPHPSISRIPRSPLNPKTLHYWLQRTAFVLVPTAVIALVGASAIWGENGLVERHRLQAELLQANTELAALERENQRLLRQLKVGREDPVAVERMVAEELGWGDPSATLYRFEDDGRKR